MSNLPEVLIMKIFNYAFYPHEMPFCNTYRYNKVINKLPLICFNPDSYRIYQWSYDIWSDINGIEQRKLIIKSCTGQYGIPCYDGEGSLWDALGKPYLRFVYILKVFKWNFMEIEECTSNRIMTIEYS